MNTATRRDGVLRRYRHWRQQSDMGLMAYGLQILIMLGFVVFFGLPLLWLLIAPTRTPEQFSALGPMTIGSVNHIVTAWHNMLSFNDAIVLTWAWNTVLYVAGGLTLAVSVSVTAGYALAVVKFRGRGVVLWATLLLMVMPGAALVLPLFLEMNQLRLLNTPWAVILPAGLSPFSVYLSFVFFKATLSADLLDAARVDGCSEIGLFWYVALPLSKTLLGLLTFLKFTHIWNDFFGPFVFLTKDALYNLPVGLQVLLSSTGALHPAMQTATTVEFYQAEVALYGLLSVLPAAAIFILGQRFVVTGVYTGATKE